MEAKFLLDAADRKALVSAVPEASEVRWYCVWRDEAGKLHHEIIPKILWHGEAAERTRATLVRLRDLKWTETASEELINHLDTVLTWVASSRLDQTV